MKTWGQHRRQIGKREVARVTVDVLHSGHRVPHEKGEDLLPLAVGPEELDSLVQPKLNTVEPLRCHLAWTLPDELLNNRFQPSSATGRFPFRLFELSSKKYSRFRLV